jgi:hypothetical protein
MSASTVIIERINGFQELETSTKRQTHLAEMILREIAQDVGVDRVFAEYRLILSEAKALQPTSDVHDGALLQPGAHYLSTPMRVMRCWAPVASAKPPRRRAAR